MKLYGKKDNGREKTPEFINDHSKRGDVVCAQRWFMHIDNNRNVVCVDSKWGEILSIYR